LGGGANAKGEVRAAASGRGVGEVSAPAKMAQTTPVWKSLSASLRKAKKTTTS
jgi:hypothetical protein